MTAERNSLKGPLGFIAVIVILEVVLAILAAEHLWWAGVALFVLISAIQAATFLLLWHVFRLVARINRRVKKMEEN